MTSSWQFQPIFDSYALVGGLLALLLVLLLVRPSFGNLSRSRRRWLAVLRGLVVVLLLAAMLRPAHISTERKTQQAKLIVLFDTSRSMQIPDGEAGRTRWEDQVRLFQSVLPRLKNMGESFQVELLGFDEDAHPQAEVGGELRILARPRGEETDIGAALNAAVKRSVGKRIAAVILMSDGAQRAVNPEVAPQQAARQLNRRLVPLFAVPFGSSRDQSQARDVAIETLADEYSIFIKNELVLRVGVRVQGYVNQSIPVRLTLEDAAGQISTLGTNEIRATQDSQTVMAEFSVRPAVPGEYRMHVVAETQPGEMVLENNSMTSFLNVREGGLRVLLLDTRLLHEEQKFIRESLRKSSDIELDFRPINILTRPQWPLDLLADVPLEDYDVFLIGDVEAAALRPDNWQRLADLVGDGRGLMMYGGHHSFGAGGFAESPLAAVLPINMSRFDVQPRDAPVRQELHLREPIIMLPTTDSPITHLGPADENLAKWTSLKPLAAVNRLGDLKERAEVLAESQNGDPLLVQMGFDSGRVLAFAGDSTWRWWKYGQQEAHKKFWRQAILWLARRDQKQASSVFIELPQRRFRAESKFTFLTGLADENGDPVVDAPLVASLRHPDGAEHDVILATSGNSTSGSIVDTKDPGVYRLTVRTEDGRSKRQAEFIVLDEDFELAEPAANPGLLDLLAKTTERVGGRTIAPEQLVGLLDQMKASPPKDEIETQSKWQLGDSELGAWSLFVLFTGLLATEWFLRKRWGLV